jgi:U3 small nucleolar RNA-associated protein 21
VISIWNLEKRKLQAVIKGAHESAVSSLQFLANEPVLLSAGTDNSLKMWIFDTSDSEARLLRFRSGHSAPPTCIRYYGNGGHILSGGLDRSFRVFSTIQDQQSRELSQGSKSARKMKLKVCCQLDSLWTIQFFFLQA